jgi:hypothetical protein
VVVRASGDAQGRHQLGNKFSDKVSEGKETVEDGVAVRMDGGAGPGVAPKPLKG